MPAKVMAKQHTATLRKLMAQRDSETEAVVNVPDKKPSPPAAAPGKVQIPENSPLTPKPGATIKPAEPKYQVPENDMKPKVRASAATAIFDARSAKAGKRRRTKPFVKAAQRKLYG